MQSNNNIEKVYDLIEQFDFTELSEFDKLEVLSVMTETEYTEMRKSIDTVKTVFQEDIEPIKTVMLNKYNKKNIISRVINFNIKLYQVAASVAILIACYYLFQPRNKHVINQNIALNSKTAPRNIDTIHTIIYDTVVAFKEKVDYVKTNISELEQKEIIPQTANKTDCSKILCANEIENITLMNSRNTISNDTTIKEILLSLN